MIEALQEELFTLDDIVNLDIKANELQMPVKLFSYCSPKIVRALKQEVITFDLFIQINKEADEEGMSNETKHYLNTVECIKAISGGAYTIKTLAGLFAKADEVEMDDELKWNLIKPYFVSAFQKNDFTVTSMAQTAQNIMGYLEPRLQERLLVQPKFFKAIHDELFTVKELAKKSELFILAILHDQCLKALRSRDVTIAQIESMSLDDLNNANISTEYHSKVVRMVSC